MPALLALPLLFAGLGAWEVWRGTAMRAGIGGPTGEHRTEAGTPPPPNQASQPLGTLEAHAAQTEIDLVVARLREGLAWLTLGAGVVTGAAGLGGLLLVRGSARMGMRSRPQLLAAFGRVSRVLPALLGVQVAGAVLALGAAVAFEASELWFVPDPMTGR